MGDVPELSLDGPVATIWLRRPDQANRLEAADLVTLKAHVEAVNARPEIMVLRIGAEGKYFCAGYNFADLESSDGAIEFQEAPNALAGARPITVAMMNGSAYGGATDLALACDFRLGIKGMHIHVPAARMGLHFYQTGLERFVSRLGLEFAKKILLACARIESDELMARHYLYQCLDDQAALWEASDHLSQDLCAMAPLAVLGMKTYLNQIAVGRLDGAGLEATIAHADRSTDLKEGVAAAKEKRPARFSGF